MCDAGVTNISLICTMSDQSNYIKNNVLWTGVILWWFFSTSKRALQISYPLQAIPENERHTFILRTCFGVSKYPIFFQCVISWQCVWHSAGTWKWPYYFLSSDIIAHLQGVNLNLWKSARPSHFLQISFTVLSSRFLGCNRPTVLYLENRRSILTRICERTRKIITKHHIELASCQYDNRKTKY